MRAVRTALTALCALAAALILAGCAELLPKARSETTGPWRNFDEAKSAIERIEPDRTTAGDLRALGIDLHTMPNVQQMSFSDILLRFPLGGGLDISRLDPGLARCLEAGKACTGFSITIRDVHRDRVGNIVEDALGFKRVVDVTGWSFNALLLVVDERIVYTLYGGQPVLKEQEVTRRPLGPLQTWGESLSINDFR